jgi:uncharacterized protein YkwD
MHLGKRAALCCSIAVGLLAAPAGASAALPQPQLPLPEVPASRLQPVTQNLVPAPVATMAGALNRARARRGLGPLQASASLRRSATRYAAWMLRADYFGHLPHVRASHRYHRLGEALALHRGRRALVRATLKQWLASPAHRALILSHRFRYFGAGRSRGRFHGRSATTWVLHFGR